MELQDMRPRTLSDSQPAPHTTHAAASQSQHPSSAGFHNQNRNTTDSQDQQSRTGSQNQQNQVRNSTGFESRRSQHPTDPQSVPFQSSTDSQSQGQITPMPSGPSQLNGAALLSDDGQRVSKRAEGVTERTEGGVAVLVQTMADKERSTAKTNAPISNRNSEGGENLETNPTDAVMEDSKQRQNSTTAFARSEEDREDKTDGVLQKEANDYERLDRGRLPSQHLYRPITDNSKAGPTRRITDCPKPPPPYASASGATSPLYDSCAVDVLPANCAKSESQPFLQQPPKRSHLPENADDIIELHNDDIAAATSTEENQNQRNTNKEIPEITNIPNTNFAIACMVAMCFNLPFGVLAMYFSLRAVKAYQDGRAKLGEKRSRWSIVLSLLGITITTVIVSSVVLYIATQGQKRISRHRAYSTKGGLNL